MISVFIHQPRDGSNPEEAGKKKVYLSSWEYFGFHSLITNHNCILGEETVYLKATSEQSLYLCSFEKTWANLFLCIKPSDLYWNNKTVIQRTQGWIKGNFLFANIQGGNCLPDFLRGLLWENVCKALSLLKRVLNYDFFLKKLNVWISKSLIS